MIILKLLLKKLWRPSKGQHSSFLVLEKWFLNECDLVHSPPCTQIGTAPIQIWTHRFHQNSNIVIRWKRAATVLFPPGLTVSHCKEFKVELLVLFRVTICNCNTKKYSTHLISLSRVPYRNYAFRLGNPLRASMQFTCPCLRTTWGWLVNQSSP